MRHAALLLSVVVSAGLASCRPGAAGPDDDGGSPSAGGTAVIAVLSDFQSFNPVTNTHLTSDDVVKHMLFTPLVQYDADLQPMPWLAESWELTEHDVTFRLRDDVFWHDGVPVTAEDVRFTFRLARDPATASLLGSAYLAMVDSAEVPDPRTIRFRFVAPHAQALDAFWWPPLPRHLLGDVPAAELARHPFNRQPVGSGPFRFREWRPGQSVTLTANPDFPQALGGRPHLDQVVFRVVPEPTTMVTELIGGTADVIGYTLHPEPAAQVERYPDVELRHFPAREFTFFAWNHRHPLFGDARVRRALTLALNRPQIVDGLLRGYAVPAAGVIPPWSPMYPQLAALPHDPAGARRLLEEAGWRDADGDGLLERAGERFSFVLTVNAANRLHQDIAQVVQRQLRQVGVEVEIRTMEFQSMLQRYRAREYEAVLANWSLDTFKVDPTPLFSCTQARVPMSANRTGYCSPEADRLMAAGVRETDPGRARAIWRAFSERLQQDQPVTFLYWSEDMAGVGPRLRNVEMDARSKIVNIREWWIPAGRRR
jgi:peptide/nickel transport system substrate-binding protein